MLIPIFTRRSLAFALAIAATVASASSQTPRSSGGDLRDSQSCYDVRHYSIDLRVDPEAKSIRGSLTMRAEFTQKGTTRIDLDLDERLTVSGVQVDGGDAQFAHADGRIAIELGDTPREAGSSFAVTVSYGGKPRVAPNPPWQGGFTWAHTKQGSPWIATTCQHEGADLWWPCKDHPSDEADTMTIAIEVPNGLVVATNGTLEEEQKLPDGWRRFTWQVRNPTNNYGVALNIAPYVEVRDTFTSITGDRVPVVFWALPDSKKQAKRLLPEILDHLKHMEEICGPYPFRNEKYGVAQTPHLGMEHQTIIAYGYGFKQESPGYDWLHHHEMAHEWWANLVTCRDWKDMWIHEGIGTYMQALYIESRFGVEEMRKTMQGARGQLMNRRAVAPRESQNTREIYFSASGNDIYYKGSWITHTLRYVLGDETFFKVLRRWAYPDPAMEDVTGGAQTRLTDTDEIRTIAEQIAGHDLAWFFDVYLHQPSLPRLSTRLDGNTMILEWKVPDGLTFPMPVPVQVGDTMHRVEMTDGKGSIDVGDKSEFEVDPYNQILRRGPGRLRRN